jgi:hypothetical protein
MTWMQRFLLALALVAVDLVAVALPLTAFGLAYVILARPLWFRRWVDRLYASPPARRVADPPP